jgi:hypothetical protein
MTFFLWSCSEDMTMLVALIALADLGCMNVWLSFVVVNAMLFLRPVTTFRGDRTPMLKANAWATKIKLKAMKRG